MILYYFYYYNISIISVSGISFLLKARAGDGITVSRLQSTMAECGLPQSKACSFCKTVVSVSDRH